MLTYAQFLTEALDQKAAIAKLAHIHKTHRFGYSQYGYIPIAAIFGRKAQYPPMQGWNDLTVHREKVGGIKLEPVPVDKLIPTQDGVELSGVERFIKLNPNKWNENEPVRVVNKKGRLYVMDGHHRSAAAILMGYPTVPAEVMNV